ncbi:MAG TPA: hypothetical protein VL179_01260, partial [Mycobacterium sp.]|nr:hypothetical protein [Mycobacterium sp.]
MVVAGSVFDAAGQAKIGALTVAAALVISDPAKEMAGMGLLGEIAELGKDVIEDRDKWADRLKTVGEFIERNAKTNKLEQIANAGRKLVDFSKKTTDFFASQLGRRLVKSAKSPILNAGQ